jgi:cytochrome b involved in lipid metabolism
MILSHIRILVIDRETERAAIALYTRSRIAMPGPYWTARDAALECDSTQVKSRARGGGTSIISLEPRETSPARPSRLHGCQPQRPEAEPGHMKHGDLWCIHGKVYDLTPFLSGHPGGPEVLRSVCGSDDLTAIFESNHAFAKRSRIAAIMSKCEVSEGEPSALRFPEGGFYRVLTQRVRAALPDGVHATRWWWLKATLLLMAWAVSVC